MGTGLSSGADAVIDAMPMVIASPLASPEYRAREIRPYDASAVRRQLSAPSVVVPVVAQLEEMLSLDRSGPSRSPAPVKRQISAPSFAAFAVNSRDASPRRPAECSSPTHPGFRGMSTVVDPSSFWLPQRDIVIPGMAVEAPQRPARPDIPMALPSSWTSQFEVCQNNTVIGTGSYATIYQVRNRRTKFVFAVKVMQRENIERLGMGPQLSKEIEAMQRANSVSDPGWSRIVQMHAVQEEGGFIFMLLELCLYGALTQHLKNAPGGLSEPTAARLSRHLFQGLRDIHAAGILHRDIKPDNLLLTTNGVLKITDFGWAAEAAESPRGLAGTFDTMAPEVLLNMPQTGGIDMWSAGAVIFNIVTGRKLVQVNVDIGTTQQRRERVLRQIQSSCPPSMAVCPNHVSEACWNLVGHLLDPDAKLRPAALEASQHPWLSSQEGQRLLEKARSAVTPPPLRPSPHGLVPLHPIG
jgi:hypothetical protein